VVHFELFVPEHQREPLTVEAKLQYRKFDTLYLNYAFGKDYSNDTPFTVTNDLPITTIASDKVTFAIEDGTPTRITNHGSRITAPFSRSVIRSWTSAALISAKITKSSTNSARPGSNAPKANGPTQPGKRNFLTTLWNNSKKPWL